MVALACVSVAFLSPLVHQLLVAPQTRLCLHAQRGYPPPLPIPTVSAGTPSDVLGIPPVYICLIVPRLHPLTSDSAWGGCVDGAILYVAGRLSAQRRSMRPRAGQRANNQGQGHDAGTEGNDYPYTYGCLRPLQPSTPRAGKRGSGQHPLQHGNGHHGTSAASASRISNRYISPRSYGGWPCASGTPSAS